MRRDVSLQKATCSSAPEDSKELKKISQKINHKKGIPLSRFMARFIRNQFSPALWWFCRIASNAEEKCMFLPVTQWNFCSEKIYLFVSKMYSQGKLFEENFVNYVSTCRSDHLALLRAVNCKMLRIVNFQFHVFVNHCSS